MALVPEVQQFYLDLGRESRPTFDKLRKTKGDPWPQVNLLRRMVFETGDPEVLTLIARELGWLNRRWLIKYIQKAEMLGCNTQHLLIGAISRSGFVGGQNQCSLARSFTRYAAPVQY
jgi:hypothetical protein